MCGSLGPFAHYVIAVILVFQNNETAAMLVNEANHAGVQLFYYVNASRTRECIRFIKEATKMLDFLIIFTLNLST